MNQPDIATIVREHQAEVWRYLRYLGCDEHDASDLTQATFVDVLRKGFDYQGEAQTAGYLRSKARFLYLSHRRTQGSREHLAEISEADEIWQSYERDDDGDGYIDALERCLNQLEERTRRVMTMQYQEGLGVAAIGRELDLSESNVKAIAMRTRASLRECIEKRLGL